MVQTTNNTAHRSDQPVSESAHSSEYVQPEQALIDQVHLLTQALDAVSEMVIIKDQHSRLQYGNAAFREVWGMTEQQLHELIAAPFTPPDTTQKYVQDDLWVLQHGLPLEIPQEPLLRHDGIELTVRTRKLPLFDQHNKVCGLVGIITDITTVLRAEAAMRQAIEQETAIRAHAVALGGLSTPLIPITDAVLVMPLVGALDTQRAQRVIETLLEGVATQRAQVVILDITGVPIVDTQVAAALLQAAQAVRLLGASIILTGIRPEVAQTLVGLGIDFSGIVTRSTLQAAIVDAFEQTHSLKR